MSFADSGLTLLILASVSVSVSVFAGENMKQQLGYSCKATAVAEMISRVTGKDYRERDFYANQLGSCVNINGRKYGPFIAEYKIDSSGTTRAQQLAKINDSLSRNLPIVVQVSPGSPHHWVTILSKSGNSYLIVDPADGKQKILSSKYTLGANGHYGYVCLNESIATFTVRTQAHVQNIGWQDWLYGGHIAGTIGQSLRMEGIKINIVNAPAGMRIKYRAHVQNIGWQNWVNGGEIAGTTGRSLRMEGIEIVLEGAPAGYGVRYKAHVQDIGWQDWVYNGQTAGTIGQHRRLEAIQIEVYRN